MKRKTWLTSDLHLGHANMAGEKTSNWKDGYRTFNSVEEMDYKLIETINEYVAQDDLLINHGDFVFGGHIKTPDYRRRINCANIIHIKGNHDKHLDKYRDLFLSVQDYLDITLRTQDGRKIPYIGCHYAFRVWLGSHKGFYHGYGHSHGNLPGQGRSEDVGVDSAYKHFGEYRPFLLEEFLNICDKRPISFVDHHTPESNAR